MVLWGNELYTWAPNLAPSLRPNIFSTIIQYTSQWICPFYLGRRPLSHCPHPSLNILPMKFWAHISFPTSSQALMLLHLQASSVIDDKTQKCEMICPSLQSELGRGVDFNTGLQVRGPGLDQQPPSPLCSLPMASHLQRAFVSHIIIVIVSEGIASSLLLEYQPSQNSEA